MLEEVYLNKTAIVHAGERKQRRLDFSGTKNFRDLGGYRTMGGKTIRWGMLYRSDALHKLTERDIQRISSLGLERVIDFRSEYEKGQEPDRWPIDAKVQRVEIPILDASTAVVQGTRDELVKTINSIDPLQYMNKTYIGFVTQFTPAFQQFFYELASAQGHPVLFHCMAGKDRTGYAAALLLRILGVPHETVMEDYLLTNEYFYSGHKWNLRMARLLKGNRFANSIRGFMLADPHYLSAAFETIDREHGSFENYIRDAIGLSPADIDHFKAIYLE